MYRMTRFTTFDQRTEDVMSITTIGNKIPAYLLGRTTETDSEHPGYRAEVIELRGRAANEAMRLRAVA